MTEDPDLIDVSWLLFVVASLALIAVPGQDMILVMSRSIAQGSAAGIVTAAGVSVGLLGHTVLATLGLGVILRTSEWLFVALKLVGAAYLLYLGIGLLLTSAAAWRLDPSPRARYPSFLSMARSPTCPIQKLPSFTLPFSRSSSNRRRSIRRSHFLHSESCSPASRSWSRRRLAFSQAHCPPGCVLVQASFPGSTECRVQYSSDSA